MTTTITYGDALGKHGIALPPDLLADVEIPVLAGPQCQGDVGIWPRPRAGAAELTTMTEVPADGIVIVRGETAGGNAHILDAATGPVLWVAAPAEQGSIDLGVLHVPDGSVALLTHTDEHGSTGIGPGTYRLTGKREQADEIRRVAD